MSQTLPSSIESISMKTRAAKGDFMKLQLLLFSIFLYSGTGAAASLDKLFANVATCQFDQFYYDEPTRNPPHPYFIERSLKPYKEENGLYFFHVKDSMFGLPVVELIVPGTQDLHGVTFDVPLVKARKVISSKFGTTFRESKKSRDGKAPVLAADHKNINRSVLYCVEGEGG